MATLPAKFAARLRPRFGKLFGALGIAEALEDHAFFALEEELGMELHRVQLFQAVDPGFAHPEPPEIIEGEPAASTPAFAGRNEIWEG